MFLKKVIIGVYLVIFLSGCAPNTALFGPAYTLATTGNITQAGITYGGNEIITKTTGKSIIENLKDKIFRKKEKKENIEETKKIKPF